MVGGASAGRARSRCARPRATHGYFIDRSAVVKSPLCGRGMVDGGSAGISSPLRGRGIVAPRSRDCRSAVAESPFRGRGITVPWSRNHRSAVAGLSLRGRGISAPRLRNHRSAVGAKRRAVHALSGEPGQAPPVVLRAKNGRHPSKRTPPGRLASSARTAAPTCRPLLWSGSPSPGRG
jgi:hypothetical protein